MCSSDLVTTGARCICVRAVKCTDLARDDQKRRRLAMLYPLVTIKFLFKHEGGLYNEERRSGDQSGLDTRVVPCFTPNAGPPLANQWVLMLFRRSPLLGLVTKTDGTNGVFCTSRSGPKHWLRLAASKSQQSNRQWRTLCLFI